jgi:hypothetical protein
MNQFQKQETQRQVAFKKRHWPELGSFPLPNSPQKTYPHILPKANLKNAFYGPIADEILHYIKKEDIALHNQAVNLKSSQAACFNFLFPFQQDISFAAGVFEQLIPGLVAVNAVEFEYTGPIEVTEWLGEPSGGKRGRNRTSIDAAVFWNDSELRRCAALIEWKYTESGYGGCSAYNKARDEKAICRSIRVAEDSNPGQHCLLTSGTQHRSRRYWEHLETAGISLQKFSELQGCPFQGPFYQLMRQFLLGTFLKQHKIVDKFEIVSMDFEGNKCLHKIPKHLQPMTQSGVDNIIDLWNRTLGPDNKMRHITVEELMGCVDNVEINDADWRRYISERYGV